MASESVDKRIQDLEPIDTLAADDLIPVSDTSYAGNAKKMTGKQLMEFALKEGKEQLDQAVADATKAAATSAAEAKAAQTAAKESQAGAEEALGQVKAIVAGNEAYTKQESHDTFALALKMDTGRGTSHEIYPDPGSNVIVTAYGYTEQEGSGDPGLKNIRPIKVGGVRMVKYVVTNPENAVLNTPAEGQPYIRITGFPTAVKLPGNKFPPAKYCSHARLFSGNYTGLYYYLGADAAIISSEFLTPGYDLSTTGLRKKLQDLIDAGDPLTFWYEAEDGSGELYVPDILDAGEKSYQCHCSSITAHLCDGDYVVSNQDDKRVEYHAGIYAQFDGTEAWKFYKQETYPDLLIIELGTNFKRVSGVYSHCKDNNSTNPGGAYFSGPGFLCNPTGGQFGDALAKYEGDTLAKWKAYLADQAKNGTPFQVVGTRDAEVTYTHAPVPLIAKPDSTGKVTVSGEKQISAVYNKSLKKAFEELSAQIIKLGGTL